MPKADTHTRIHSHRIRTESRGRRESGPVVHARGGPVRSTHRTKGSLTQSQPATGWIAVKNIRENFGVSRKVFARLTSFSERAIAGWESGQKLSPQSRQRMAEMQRLQEALAEVIDPNYVSSWLEAPNPAFNNLKPLEVVERGEIDRIWQMIFELRSGIPG